MKLLISDCGRHMAVIRGCGGWGNDGGGEGGGKGGWGEALIEVFNKTGVITFSLGISMHITRQNRLKITILRGSPILAGNSLVMTS